MAFHYHLNSPLIHSTTTRQTMRNQFLCLLSIGTLLFGGWPTLLHAEAPEKLPEASDTPAFLLVASQHMADPRFRKSVLLVTRHGRSGPIGVIVNRPEKVTLDKMLPEYPAAKKFSLFNGGPVFPAQVSYIVRGGDAVENALMISSDIYLAYDMPILGELLSGKRRYKDLRVMHGLASWAPGQLEYEIKLGDWNTLPVDDAVIFNMPPAKMWQELHDRATRYHEI